MNLNSNGSTVRVTRGAWEVRCNDELAPVGTRLSVANREITEIPSAAAIRAAPR